MGQLAWGTTGLVGGREPVFTWTPSGPATVDRAVLDGVTGEGEGGAGLELCGSEPIWRRMSGPSLFMSLVTEEVGRRLGLPTELVVETSYESCEKDMNEVCFVCSLPYVTFERRGLDLAVPVAAPVIMGARYRGRPIYFSDPTARVLHPSTFEVSNHTIRL